MAGVGSVADALERIRGPATTVTTYGPERDEALHAFLGRFAVELHHEQLPVPAEARYLTVRSGGEYRGAWTYDPDLVREFTAYLDGIYGSGAGSEPGDPGQSSAGSEPGAASESSAADGRGGSDEHNR